MHRLRIRPRHALRLCSFLPLIPLVLVTPQLASASQDTSRDTSQDIPSASPAAPGNEPVVFSDFFKKPDWGTPGATWCPYTSAYPDGRTNPDDWKLDQLTPSTMSILKGGGLQFRATPATRSPSGLWNTGLLTTEPWDGGPCGGNGFTLQADDFVLVHLRLPNRTGGGGHSAWPGVWTWKDGGNEVDIMEWHSEAPDHVEFVNHVNGDAGAIIRSSVVGFGKWIYIGARIGTDTITWYLGTTPKNLKAVFSDHQGVPADWQAYLVLNLSVSAQGGRGPTARTPITVDVAGVQVFRPLAQPMPAGG